MDCRQAYFYLNVRGPGDALSPETVADLDGHLASCPACATLAHTRAAEEVCLARAMTAVPVPATLRDKLQGTLRNKQKAVSRRRWVRASAMAAAVLLMVGIGIGFNAASRPRLNLEDWAQQADFQVENPDEAARLWLAEMNLPTQLPLAFDLSLLVFRGSERMQGRDVPVLVFRERNGPEVARVYICRDEQFAQLKSLQEAQASRFTALLLRDAHLSPDVTYVVMYTGNNLDRFLRSRAQARL
jgi:hypothetical protein